MCFGQAVTQVIFVLAAFSGLLIWGRQIILKSCYGTVRHYYPEIDPDAAYDRWSYPFCQLLQNGYLTWSLGWMAAGFVHGVLNTDNFNITGESFDYGPWRFLPHLDPGFTAAYFDETGRYAYGRQPLCINVGLMPAGRLFCACLRS